MSACFSISKKRGLMSTGIVIVAGPGDRLVIPPDYGHVTVNIGTTPLVVADLVATASSNHYQGYANRQGGAVRIMAVPGEDEKIRAETPPAPEPPKPGKPSKK